MAQADTGEMRGRVAIVTGAGQGGGRGSALALAAKGVRVALFGRTAAKLEAVAAEIAARGSEALIVSGDVTSAADRTRCVAETAARFGRIDILVNTAQSPEQRDQSIDDVTLEVTQQLWESGFVATLELMRACRPHMRAAGGGVIVNFGSGSQLNPINFPVYGAVKAAVATMSRSAALEWAPENIRVHTVIPLAQAPSYETFKINNPEKVAAFEARIPLGRMGDPELDIGRAVAFLAGPEASFMTGTSLGLDGGIAFVR